jgi:hypothetical protein
MARQIVALQSAIKLPQLSAGVFVIQSALKERMGYNEHVQ